MRWLTLPIENPAAAPAVERIDSYGRRAPDVIDAKLHNHIIDFHQPQQWVDEVRGDTVFIYLGTTLKAAGSKDTQWQIDYQAAPDFARAARQNGAGTLVLVSAAGANARSPFFYPRMKGALEEAITALGYPRLRIFRPPLLIRPDSDRPGEKISARVLHGLNAIGLLRSQRPLPIAALDPQDGVKTYSPADIRQRLQEGP
ncbi:Rossmann-fold NAD(P)-binding domain-containing protein [Cardiobacterium valvarum]|nr:epimerase [Cardiobacterium valvarum]